MFPTESSSEGLREMTGGIAFGLPALSGVEVCDGRPDD